MQQYTITEECWTIFLQKVQNENSEYNRIISKLASDVMINYDKRTVQDTYNSFLLEELIKKFESGKFDKEDLEHSLSSDIAEMKHLRSNMIKNAKKALTKDHLKVCYNRVEKTKKDREIERNKFGKVSNSYKNMYTTTQIEKASMIAEKSIYSNPEQYLEHEEELEESLGKFLHNFNSLELKEQKLILYILEDYPTKEISEELGITISNTNTRKSRLINKLGQIS